jgi:hypothetical protein
MGAALEFHQVGFFDAFERIRDNERQSAQSA